MLLTFALYLLLGAVAGFVAGLFGIGGGLIIVPVLIFSFSAQGMSPEVLTHAAVATSLGTIVFTSIASIRAHHQKGAVCWNLFPPMSVGILAGALSGVWIAGALSGSVLQLLFGVFTLCVAAQMVFDLRPKAGGQVPGSGELVVAGGGVGCASAIFGIGGGTLTVPYLHWRRLSMQQAVATSAACGLPIALTGAVGNIWSGWNEARMPDWHLGYIYLPALIGIVLASSFSARYGARLAHRLPQRQLKRVFALLLAVVGLRFLITNLISGL
ncbi:sulfite exporter TauE/SafE family protein [Marinobacterium sp. D7]|uniref:sulfite exporter TauE/SafE family protein n=1 Tax=Marinobacterium ramblicola TaxID=2849041 RepID=UPI001C2D3D94|nr:sulfite exporter TauE/SafE family protein [Marinobacterium ramblicola]MBV1787906.1 sulfite exporter TauE/SafE family protein [Marinobacterium ramblicola]